MSQHHLDDQSGSYERNSSLASVRDLLANCPPGTLTRPEALG